MGTVPQYQLVLPDLFLIPNYRSHDLCVLLWSADASQDPEEGITKPCEPPEDLPFHFIGSSTFQPAGERTQLDTE